MRKKTTIILFLTVLSLSVLSFRPIISSGYETDSTLEQQAKKHETAVVSPPAITKFVPAYDTSLFLNHKLSNTKFFFGDKAYTRQAHFRLPELQPSSDENINEDDISSPAKTPDGGKEAEPQKVLYDIEIDEDRQSVQRFVDYFHKKINVRLAKWLDQSAQYIPMMRGIFREHGLPEDLVYLSLIESGFNPYAYSRAKAAGPWQFIRGTALKYGLKIDTWVDERRDPVKATNAAATYLSDLYGMFNSWPLALAAYNAGEGRVGRVVRRANTDDYWVIRKSSRYLRRETRNYVPKFMAGVMIAKNPEKYGFNPIPHKPWKYDNITFSSPVDMRVVARILDIPYLTIKDLNPELRKSVTPLNSSSYTLRLPPNTKEKVLAGLSKLPPEKMLIGKIYKIRKGDSLYRIAKKQNTTIALLLQVNNISKKSVLKVGNTLYLPSIKTHGRAVKKKKYNYKVVKKTANGKKHITYRVRKGDNLWNIAKAFNVNLKSLQGWNNIWGKKLIKPGDKLSLYVK